MPIVGSVQGAGKPIAGSTVTLFSAGTGAPTQLAHAKTDDQGAFKLTYGEAPADSVLYVIARGGTPKAAADKGPNDAVALLAVLGGTPPKSVVDDEFSTIASVWTSAQFLKGEVLSGTKLGLPSCSWVSTEAMCPDPQAAIEKSIGFFSHFCSGVSLIWGAGQLESQMTVSPAQAVMDDEIIAYVRRYCRGVTVDAQTLAVAVTRSVGIGGEFLAADHTAAHHRAELYQPQLLWRKAARGLVSSWQPPVGRSG
ncbi:MAG: trimethylamine methyltransferase family protein [Thermoguttaceae bacterium]|jgi:hypothetical protein